MSESKSKVKKKEKLYWKITAPSFVGPVLRPKAGTSKKVLAAIKAKEGYKVEEA
jgi:hypothetical protein